MVNLVSMTNWFILVNVVSVVFYLLNIKRELMTRFWGMGKQIIFHVHFFMPILKWLWHTNYVWHRLYLQNKNSKTPVVDFVRVYFLALIFFLPTITWNVCRVPFLNLCFHWISLFSHPFIYLFFSLVCNTEFHLSGTESSKANLSVHSVLCVFSHFFFSFLFLQEIQDKVLFFLTFSSYLLFQMKRKPPRLVLCLQVRMIPILTPLCNLLSIDSKEKEKAEDLDETVCREGAPAFPLANTSRKNLGFNGGVFFF